MRPKALAAVLAIAVLLMSAISAKAQLAAKVGDVAFKFRFGGQTNVDVGTFLGADDHKANRNGIAVNDCRLALWADIDTMWQAKLEVSYEASKISFKDVYVLRQFHNIGSEVKLGNYFMPFGFLRGGLFFKFVDSATSDYVFTPGRKLGIAYQKFSDHFNWGAGFYSDGNVSNGKKTNQGYSFSAYALARPIISENNVLHFMVSGILTHPSDQVSFSAPMPLAFTSFNLMKTDAMDVYNYGRLELSALAIVRRFYAEAHFLKAWVNRPNEVRTTADDGTVSVTPQDNYNGAYGFYVQATWSIIGLDQNYNKQMGIVFNPNSPVLEALIRFDRTDLDQFGADNNVTIGLNYHINKYLRVRVNYVHASVKGGADIDAMCSRVQFSF